MPEPLCPVSKLLIIKTVNTAKAPLLNSEKQVICSVTAVKAVKKRKSTLIKRMPISLAPTQTLQPIWSKAAASEALQDCCIFLPARYCTGYKRLPPALKNRQY